MEQEKKLSKYEQERHLRLFNEALNKEQFDGIYITGVFEEPALIFCLNRLPNKHAMNILKNSVTFSEDKELVIYLYVNGKGYKLGRVDRSIKEIYILEDILKRYGLEMIEVDGGKKRKVSASDYIVTLKL